jgi:ABC-type glycerol-3-phosphate transport system substrate-binding protein
MSTEPKKVDRRNFLYVGLGAVALVAIGAAAYIAMNPPVVTQTITTATTATTTVPTTTVITQPTTTVVTTTTATTVTTTQPTPTTTMPWELIKWDQPSFEERLTGVKIGPIPDHWIQRFPTLKTYKKEPIAAIGGYQLPKGWEQAVSGVKEIKFLNYGGLAHDPATEMALCAFEDLTGIHVEAKEMEELTLWLKTVSIMTAKSDAIDIIDVGGTIYGQHVVKSGWALPIDFLWPPEAQKLYSPLNTKLCKFGEHWYYTGMISTKPFVPYFRPSWLKQATGSSEPPKTWVDVVEVMAQVAKWAKDKLGPGYYGIVMPGKDHRYMWINFVAPLYSLGGWFLDSKGNINVLSTEFRKAFEIFVKMGQNGAMPAEALGWAWTDPGELFGKGKAGFIHDGVVNISRYMSPTLYPDIKDDWIATIPLSYDSKTPPAVAEASSAALAVNPYTSPKQQAAAMLFLDFYRSYQVQWNELAFEGNETVATALYDREDVKNTIPLPNVKKTAIEVSKTEMLPPGADEALARLLEWWQKAVLGTISIDEALTKAQKDIDAIAATF